MTVEVGARPSARGGRFELGAALGEGAFGRVYEAVDREYGRRVALKTLPDLDAGNRARVRAEFEGLRAFSHPNLVALGELFDDERPAFYSMRLVRGVDVIAYVRGAPAAPEGAAPVVMGQRVNALGRDGFRGCSAAQLRRLRASFAQAARALSALHAAGFIHRDVTPANFLVEPTGALFITDYGPRPTDSVAGIAAYMAPEQRADDRASADGDWYSFGVVLFEALTGALPFAGDAREVMLRKTTVRAPSPALLVRDVPPDLNELCCRLLERRPGDRPVGDKVCGVLGTSGPFTAPVPGGR